MYTYEKNNEKVDQLGSGSDLETGSKCIDSETLARNAGPEVMRRLMGNIQDDLSSKAPSPCPLLAVSEGSTDWGLQAFALPLLIHGRPRCGKHRGQGIGDHMVRSGNGHVFHVAPTAHSLE